MKEARELAQGIAAHGMRTGNQQEVDGAIQFESYASLLYKQGKLPESIYDDFIVDFKDQVPEGVPAELEPPVTFQIWSKKECPPGLQGSISKENEDLVTDPEYHWRWDDHEVRGSVKRTGRKSKEEPHHIYLAELVLARKLGRDLKQGEEYAIQVDHNPLNFSNK